MDVLRAGLPVRRVMADAGSEAGATGRRHPSPGGRRRRVARWRQGLKLRIITPALAKALVVARWRFGGVVTLRWILYSVSGNGR